MNSIFENWRGFLSEKLMLRKHKSGWKLYAQLVAEAYASSSTDTGLVGRYVKLGQWLEGEFGRISTRTKIEFVPEHPYKSAREMRKRVAEEGVIYVSTSDAEHPIWTGEQGLIWNTMFRAWHDWQGHIEKGKGFNLQGEIAAYNAHAKMVPQECVPILFTEVVGQICCFYNSDKLNCDQKAVILDDFDHIRVGALTPQGEERFGYTLDEKNKILIPKNT